MVYCYFIAANSAFVKAFWDLAEKPENPQRLNFFSFFQNFPRKFSKRVKDLTLWYSVKPEFLNLTLILVLARWPEQHEKNELFFFKETYSKVQNCTLKEY